MNHGVERAMRTAAARRADHTVEALDRLIGAGAGGPAALTPIIADAFERAGCTVNTTRYDPTAVPAVPLVKEFATAAAGTAHEEAFTIGHLAGRGKGRSLILFAHPDTEPLPEDHGWSSDPFTPTHRDGRVFGWGVADDLAGIAMMSEALAVLSGAGLLPTGDVSLVSAPSKRHRRGIAAALAAGLHADAAVYLHPAESGRGLDEIKAFAPGQLEFVIRLTGAPPQTAEPAHTAFAHLAKNPVAALAPLLNTLHAVDTQRAARLNAPRLEAAIGRSANLMVSHCAYGDVDALSRLSPVLTLGGALTTVPEEDLRAVMAEVETAIDAARQGNDWPDGIEPALSWRAGVSAAETTDEAPILRTVTAVLRDLGAAPAVNPLHTSSDIRNPIVQRAIPTVGFGPCCGGLAMAGLANEWVDNADHLRAVLAVALLVARWCGVTPRQA